MAKPKAPKYPPIIGRYVALAALWDAEGGNPPLFPSKHSAQWFIREHREALVKGLALVVDLGRVLVDLDAVAKVRERVAIDTAQRRLDQAA